MAKPQQIPNTQEILTQQELSERLSVTPETIRRWEKSHKFPRLTTPGAARYSWEQVYQWLNNQSFEDENA